MLIKGRKYKEKRQGWGAGEILLHTVCRSCTQHNLFSFFRWYVFPFSWGEAQSKLSLVRGQNSFHPDIRFAGVPGCTWIQRCHQHAKKTKWLVRNWTWWGWLSTFLSCQWVCCRVLCRSHGLKASSQEAPLGVSQIVPFPYHSSVPANQRTNSCLSKQLPAPPPKTAKWGWMSQSY